MEEDILSLVKSEARKYTDENFISPNAQDFLIIYNAMLRASQVALKRQTEQLGIEIKNIRESLKE